MPKLREHVIYFAIYRSITAGWRLYADHVLARKT